MITANNNTLFYKMQVNQIFICLGPSGYIDGIDGCWRRYVDVYNINYIGD